MDERTFSSNSNPMVADDDTSVTEFGIYCANSKAFLQRFSSGRNKEAN